MLEFRSARATLVATTLSVLCLAPLAPAETVKVLGAPAVTAIAGGWQYDYSLVLDSNSELAKNTPDQNHMFVMLDIPGLFGVPSFAKSADLIAYETAHPGTYTYNTSSELITSIDKTNLNGFTLLGTTLIGGTLYRLNADSGSLLNAKLSYPDDMPIDAASNSLPLGTFTIKSIYGPTVLSGGVEFSIDHVNPPGPGHRDQITITPFEIPAAAVPTPSALWGGLAILGSLAGFRACRRNSR